MAAVSVQAQTLSNCLKMKRFRKRKTEGALAFLREQQPIYRKNYANMGPSSQAKARSMALPLLEAVFTPEGVAQGLLDLLAINISVEQSRSLNFTSGPRRKTFCNLVANQCGMAQTDK